MRPFDIGDKVLITTDEWFRAPDGALYKAVFGTVKAVLDSESTLGVRTNARSTNWYVSVGNMIIAGCQIHYAVKTKACNLGAADSFTLRAGEVKDYQAPSAIYNADEEYSSEPHQL